VFVFLQVVLAIGQVEWTRAAEEAIHKSGAKGLAEYARFLQDQLSRTVDVRRARYRVFSAPRLTAVHSLCAVTCRCLRASPWERWL
jgi:hypothetical protein